MPVFKLSDFMGIDEAAGATDTSPSVAASAHNMDTNAGLLATAQGYFKIIPQDVPGTVRRVMRFDSRTASGIVTYLLVATDTEVLVLGEDGWDVLFSGAQSYEWNYVVWEKLSADCIILANGIDPVKIWYGNTASLADLGGLPQIDGQTVTFKYLALHRERLWGAGFNLAPDSVFFSRTFDPENWSGDPLVPIQGGGEIAVAARDGSTVSGLQTVFEDVVIFRTDRTMRIYGDNPDNYQLVTVRGSFGPISAQSIVDAGNICWFWTRDGLGYYDGMSTGLVDDRKIRTINQRVNRVVANTVSGIMAGNVLYMALPLDDATAPNAVLEYDTSRQTYMLHENIPAQDFCYSSAMRENLYMGIGVSVMARGTNQLDGAPLSAEWVSPWYELGDKSKIKTISRIQAHGQFLRPDGNVDKLAEMTITVESDQGTAEKKFGVRSGYRGRVGASLLLTGSRFRVIVRNVVGSILRLDGGIELEVVSKRGAF